MRMLFGAASVMGFLCCAQDAAAADQNMGFFQILTHPAMRMLIIALVVAIVESLKQWKWLKDRVLTLPIARAGMALAVSLVPATMAWASSGDIDDAVSVLLSTWLGSMGLNAALGAANKSVVP